VPVCACEAGTCPTGQCCLNILIPADKSLLVVFSITNTVIEILLLCFLLLSLVTSLQHLTKSEIESKVGAALAAPTSADRAAKAKFKFVESRRKKRMRKNYRHLY